MSSEQALDDVQATLYRSACMRLGYAALDRPEVQFAAKECARGMSTPTQRHMSLLKRAARFTLEDCDTHWAGCKLTRRSTSAMVAFAGQHCLLTASTTQIPIALSGGEAFPGAKRSSTGSLARQAEPSAWSLCTPTSAWQSQYESRQTHPPHSALHSAEGAAR